LFLSGEEMCTKLLHATKMSKGAEAAAGFMKLYVAILFKSQKADAMTPATEPDWVQFRVFHFNGPNKV